MMFLFRGACATWWTSVVWRCSFCILLAINRSRQHAYRVLERMLLQFFAGSRAAACIWGPWCCYITAALPQAHSVEQVPWHVIYISTVVYCVYRMTSQTVHVLHYSSQIWLQYSSLDCLLGFYFGYRHMWCICGVHLRLGIHRVTWGVRLAGATLPEFLAIFGVNQVDDPLGA